MINKVERFHHRRERSQSPGSELEVDLCLGIHEAQSSLKSLRGEKQQELYLWEMFSHQDLFQENA